MIKAKKRQTDQLLNLIAHAHRAVEDCVKHKKLYEAALVLEDCQDAAIGIGQRIDQEEREDTKTVKCLEKYCEVLYLVHEDLLSGDEISSESVTEQLNSSFKCVKSCYEDEIYETKEVVFLPYKASMWDSLESVWRKYDADPQWTARVVPIPYYDKNPDGTFGEYHYEGAEYPKDVPVVNYREYDLEENHPNEIYIHNPYDGANYVTSVYPDYYSSELKKYTDKLIYIPYFVLNEPDPNNQASVEGVSHFARTPGVFYADEVIVQSENMRKCYIKALVEYAGEETRPIWEQKIKGTGSPKFEKLSHTSREELNLPEGWHERIYREDGTAKKVVLYNTGVSALLQGSEEMVEKIKDVLEFFRENREKVTLLWRPHPLIEATICSMRPQLWEAYRRIVEWYRAEDFGIYDDTADLDRAIAISDAYYGDDSSVVQLCRSVHMPVMIQNPYIRQFTEEKVDKKR